VVEHPIKARFRLKRAELTEDKANDSAVITSPTSCRSSVETRAYTPARNTFAGIRAWNRILPQD
jgi:hypothetical protein